MWKTRSLQKTRCGTCRGADSLRAVFAKPMFARRVCAERLLPKGIFREEALEGRTGSRQADGGRLARLQIARWAPECAKVT